MDKAQTVGIMDKGALDNGEWSIDHPHLLSNSRLARCASILVLSSPCSSRLAGFRFGPTPLPAPAKVILQRRERRGTTRFQGLEQLVSVDLFPGDPRSSRGGKLPRYGTGSFGHARRGTIH
jgi:hypothetical protein